MKATRIGVAAMAAMLTVAFAIAPAHARTTYPIKTKTTITASGSTSVAPLFAAVAKQYVKKNEGKVAFRLLQGGSDIGVRDVAEGKVDIGNSSRDPKPTDPGGLTFNKVAFDAICLITHPSNRLPDLNQETVQAIFAGDVRNWEGVPGATVSGTIDVNVRTAASGTQDAFQKIFMDPKKVFTGASQKASNGLIQQAVSSNPNAIGYVSLAFTEGANSVNYKSVACNLENSKSLQYPGLRTFYMVTRNDLVTSAVAKFINFVQNNKKAAKAISKEWVPIN